MTKKAPNRGDGTQRIADEIYAAHKVHTLAQMIYQQLSTHWPTHSAQSAPSAQMPIPAMSPVPQQAHSTGYVGWPQFQAQIPVHCAAPTIVYWYP